MSNTPESLGISGLLLNPTKLWIIGGLTLSLLGYMGYQHFRIVTLERDNFKQQLAIVEERNEKDRCKATLAHQNENIQIAKDKVVEYKSRLDALQDILGKQTIINSTLIEELRGEQAPQSCEEIAKYLRNGLKDLKWED